MFGRLLCDAGRTQSHRRATAVRTGNDVDRDVLRLGIVLQQIEQHEAVDVG